MTNVLKKIFILICITGMALSGGCVKFSGPRPLQEDMYADTRAITTIPVIYYLPTSNEDGSPITNLKSVRIYYAHAAAQVTRWQWYSWMQGTATNKTKTVGDWVFTNTTPVLYKEIVASINAPVDSVPNYYTLTGLNANTMYCIWATSVNMSTNESRSTSVFFVPVGTPVTIKLK